MSLDTEQQVAEGNVVIYSPQTSFRYRLTMENECAIWLEDRESKEQ